MSSFYTSVMRYGNSILYVGYEGGHRIKESVKFKPTLFVPTRNETKYRTLDEVAVEMVKQGTMRE